MRSTAHSGYECKEGRWTIGEKPKPYLERDLIQPRRRTEPLTPFRAVHLARIGFISGDIHVLFPETNKRPPCAPQPNIHCILSEEAHKRGVTGVERAAKKTRRGSRRATNSGGDDGWCTWNYIVDACAEACLHRFPCYSSGTSYTIWLIFSLC